MFLSVTSIYLQSLRKRKTELSSFLIKRGLWLMVADLLIVNLGMTFNPLYTVQILPVIWATGLSMVILGGLIQGPFRLILALGLVIVLGHNLLDSVEAAPGFKPTIGMLINRLSLPISIGLASKKRILITQNGSSVRSGIGVRGWFG